MKKISFLSAILISSVSFHLCALEDPTGSEYDSRIKKVAYNADDVVKIDAVKGVETHIILDPTEQYITYAFGDSAAWTFGHKLNHYFIKPKEALSDTNLTIVTDKRNYNFDIRFHDLPYQKTGSSQFHHAFTFQVTFTYPEVEAAKAKALAKKAELEHQLNEVKSHGYNLKYKMNGSKAITPMNVWDDGVFTYMKFPAGKMIPVIYYVDSERKEHLAGQHSTGPNNEIVVLHYVNNEWHLRAGKQVVGIYTDNITYSEAPNNTTTLRVKRGLIHE